MDAGARPPRSLFRRTCRRHGDRHFDIHVIASGYLRVYQSILEQSPDAAAGVALNRIMPQPAVQPSRDVHPALVA
jgi:hypothetical protein